MTRTALAVYLVFAAPHLVIHVQLLHRLTPCERVQLPGALTVAVVIRPAPVRCDRGGDGGYRRCYWPGGRGGG